MKPYHNGRRYPCWPMPNKRPPPLVTRLRWRTLQEKSIEPCQLGPCNRPIIWLSSSLQILLLGSSDLTKTWWGTRAPPDETDYHSSATTQLLLMMLSLLNQETTPHDPGPLLSIPAASKDWTRKPGWLHDDAFSKDHGTHRPRSLKPTCRSFRG